MEEKTKINIPLTQLPDTYKMVIPLEVERKIRYLLNSVFNIEWSGILFYTYNGSFEEGNLEIICKDILPMDIGNSTFTEFNMSPDVISYMTENPELLDCQIGLIHSHHNFSAYFSGTDTKTLLEEGKDRNNFVSLIVNNAGDYKAAITRRVKSTKTIEDCYSYEFFDKGETKQCKEYLTESEEVQYFYLNIIKEKEEQTFQGLSERLEEIKKAKKEAQTKKTSLYGDTYRISMQELPYNYNNGRQASLFDNIDNESPRTYDTVKSNSSYKKSTKWEDDLPDVHFNKIIVRSIVAQIVTGCVTINEEKLGDIKKVNMDSLYTRRFKDTNDIFNSFVDYLIEFLLWYTEDVVLSETYDADITTAILARDVLEELDKLPSNRFLEVFKEKISKYLAF